MPSTHRESRQRNMGEQRTSWDNGLTTQQPCTQNSSSIFAPCSPARHRTTSLAARRRSRIRRFPKLRLIREAVLPKTPLYTCRKSAAKLPCRLWATGTRARRSFETYRTRDAPKLCLVGVGQFLGKPKPELNYPSPLLLGCSLNTSRLTHGPTLKKRFSPEQVAKQLPSVLQVAGRLVFAYDRPANGYQAPLFPVHCYQAPLFPIETVPVMW